MQPTIDTKGLQEVMKKNGHLELKNAATPNWYIVQKKWQQIY